MKKIIAPLILITISTNCFASIDHSKYKALLNEIQKDETSHQYKRAAIKASAAANRMAEESNFDELVQSVQTTLTEDRKEVVTETVNRHAGFKLLGLLSGSANESIDVAKIITTNQKQVEDFSSVKASDFSSLQKKLKSYVQKNETNLFYAKILSAKSLQLTAKMPIEEIPEIYSYVTKTAQRVSMVNFLGLQNITNCITIDHASRSNSIDASVSGFILSLGVSEKTQQNAYTETNCELSSISASASELATQSSDLMLADSVVQVASKQLALKVLTETEAPTYPTWGSPYMNH